MQEEILYELKAKIDMIVIGPVPECMYAFFAKVTASIVGIISSNRIMPEENSRTTWLFQ